MAKKETFLLVSLQEEKAKDLAKIIHNDSSRKILNYLANADFASESQLSKELELPISTVHYNLVHLQQGGLIEVDEFHYSKKGKEINHYKLANKFIIISPKPTEKIRSELKKRLKSLLPVVLVAVAVGWVTKLFSVKNTALSASSVMIKEDASFAMASGAIENTQPNVFLWFFAGVFTVVILYLIYELIRNKFKIKKKLFY